MALLFDVELQLMSPFSPSFSLSVMLWLLINSGIPFDNSLLLQERSGCCLHVKSP
jgi:hypothetical protein